MTKSTRFNIVSETADGLGFASRLVQDGESVRMWIRNHDSRSVGDNIVDKVGDFEDLLIDADPRNDVFMFDASGNGVFADYLTEQSFAVLGGSILADRLERDRAFGSKVMQDCGIVVPETRSFTDFDKAKQFVEQHPNVRWVYKPSKHLGDVSASHVSYDAEDLIEMLDNIAKDVSLAKPQFELQAFEKGVALSTEFWFQHGQLVPGLVNHTLERKQLMNDDLGPSGGCLGNLVWACGGCPVCDAVSGLVHWAQRERYHGMLDINTIVAERQQTSASIGKLRVLGLEFTPRFGYDATPTLFWELTPSDLGDFLASFARGQYSGDGLRDGFAAALRVTIPPWPTERHTAEENVPIRGIDTRVLEHNTYLYNVKADDSSKLCTAGAWGIVCLFTNHSSNPRRVFGNPLEWADKLRLKNKQYRTELAERFIEDLDLLATVGVEVNNDAVR